MPRALSFLLPLLALLLSLQPAPGKALLGDENRIGGSDSSFATALWAEPLSNAEGTWEEPPEGYDFASDVRNGFNLYAYCLGDPVNGHDYLGMETPVVIPPQTQVVEAVVEKEIPLLEQLGSAAGRAVPIVS